MLDALSSRRIRRFYLYREGLHAATIAAEPGRISFTARADDYHPFITAAYHNGFYEPELHALLRDSNSFDEFLLLLVPAGFDIVSDDMPPGTPLGTGVRLLDQLCPAAVCFTRGGQRAVRLPAGAADGLPVRMGRRPLPRAAPDGGFQRVLPPRGTAGAAA